jgi:hypothetical protein
MREIKEIDALAAWLAGWLWKRKSVGCPKCAKEG